MEKPHRPPAAEFADEPARGLVSIILPTYNEQETIIDRIQSILEAVSDPVEIIVVDDDSPDGTWSIVEDLDDPRIKVIRREGTRGLATAIHRGIIESRGELVGWMDADMSMPADRLPIMIVFHAERAIVIVPVSRSTDSMGMMSLTQHNQGKTNTSPRCGLAHWRDGKD